MCIHWTEPPARHSFWCHGLYEKTQTRKFKKKKKVGKKKKKKKTLAFSQIAMTPSSWPFLSFLTHIPLLYHACSIFSRRAPTLALRLLPSSFQPHCSVCLQLLCFPNWHPHRLLTPDFFLNFFFFCHVHFRPPLCLCSLWGSAALQRSCRCQQSSRGFILPAAWVVSSTADQPGTECLCCCQCTHVAPCTF